jgi:hypothetical protein
VGAGSFPLIKLAKKLKEKKNYPFS